MKQLEHRPIVVKVGSNVLVENGSIHQPAFDVIGASIKGIKKAIVVSSAAKAAGAIPSCGPEWAQQAHPATRGWPRVLAAWRRALPRCSIASALVTTDTLAAHKAIPAALRRGHLPVLNEHDSFTAEQPHRSFGNNDRLASEVAVLVGAAALVLLTNVPGLLEVPERPDSTIREIAPTEAIAFVADATSTHGTGGMMTKIDAAQFALAHGVSIVGIADGREPCAIQRVLDGEIGTLFVPDTTVG